MTEGPEFDRGATVTPSEGAWRNVIADMEATADSYEDAGWDVLACRPGDATVVPDGDTAGLDVLLPDNEYETIESLFDDGVTFTEYEVLQAVEAGIVYVVVVMEDPEREQALLYPAYYALDDVDDLLDSADEEGLHTYLRRLKGDYVELVHEDPELFRPRDSEGASEASD